MKVTSNKIHQNWLIILLIMMAGFAIIGIYILVSGNNLTKQATDSFYSYNLQEKKKQSKIEISNRLDEIKFERSKLLDAEKKNINEKIKHVSRHLNISLDTLEDNSPNKQQLALKEFENEISWDKDYLYFAVSTDGIIMRSGIDNAIIGTNLSKSKDIEGNYFILDIMKAKHEPNGIYVTYYWPKVKGGQPKKKTSYCLYLPEYDFIIGTGVYLEDIQSRLQDKIYKRLQSYYESKINYIFVTEFDSTARVSSSSDLIGQKMDKIKSFDGKSIHKKFMDTLKTADDGYISYNFYKKNNKELTEKITYVHKLFDWGAYIAIGFYLDDLHKEVENYSHIFKKHYYNQALYTVLGLILLSFVVYAIFQRGAYMQKVLLIQGDIIYTKLFELSNDAIVVVSNKKKLLYENEIAEKMFNKKAKFFFNTDNRHFKEVDKDIYSFEVRNGRNHYLRIRKEEATYNNCDSIIYFISDITKQYLESNALEKMAYIDQLTGLPNRRSLVDNFENIYNEVDEKTTYIIGILDIDKFKNINDTYGHNIGDMVLKLLSKTFTTRLRNKDNIYRYGGDEFIVLLNNISINNAKELLENIKKNFYELNKKEQGFTCTFSCGLIDINHLNINEPLEEFILSADNLLYKAKGNGRNRIEI